MTIKKITTDDLRRMKGTEGLILQGCGGALSEWVNGINEMLTEADILQHDSKIANVCSFKYGKLICLLFSFEDVEVDIGKLSLWRLQTHDAFGGTWLSDFVVNRLGGFLAVPSQESVKPDCALIGQNGNIYNLVGIATHTLRKHGQDKQAEEMMNRVFSSGSYEDALCILGEYVNITDSQPSHTPSKHTTQRER